MSATIECPPLILSVKTGTWRCHDVEAEDKDIEFQVVRDKILQRDKSTCKGCGAFTTRVVIEKKPDSNDGGVAPGTRRGSGYFEVHHIDDDHGNNDPSNLILLCPYCHGVFHCGNAGHRGMGMIIDAPWISQADLNILMHAMFSVIARSEDKVYMGEIKPANKTATVLSADEAKQVREIAEEVRRRYASLQNLSAGIEARFGQGMSDAAKFGRVLLELHRRNPKRYAEREKFLGGARLLPFYDYFNTPIQLRLIPPVQYWASRPANNGYAPLQLFERLEQWSSEIKNALGQ